MQSRREVSKEVIFDLAKQLFHEVIAEMSVQLGTATVHASRTFLLQAEYVCTELINDLVSQLVRSQLSSLSLPVVLNLIVNQLWLPSVL